MAMSEVQYKFPDEQEGSLSGGKEATAVENDVDIEVVDDTPSADRGREPLPKKLTEELEDDDLTSYSDRVRERMSQLKKVWHDERREKESAARQREEAIRYAQAIMEENKQLRGTLTYGEQNYVQVAKQAAEYELEMARRSYREAYDSGDADKLIDAQTQMNESQMKLGSLNSYRMQYQTPLQEVQYPVNIAPEQPKAPTPDKQALKWQEDNRWFGSDVEMTSLALGLHEKLVKNGVDPTSADYYRQIDATMRKRFPENFGGETLDEGIPAQRAKAATVVAPATRSTAPKKVRLTETQLALASRFKLTPEQYAREMLKLEKQNG